MGTLLAGLLVGHLRTRYPLFGRIPDGAVSLMTFYRYQEFRIEEALQMVATLLGGGPLTPLRGA